MSEEETPEQMVKSMLSCSCAYDMNEQDQDEFVQSLKERGLLTTREERTLLEICAESRKAWSERDPHDDFRFGKPRDMAFGRAIEEALARHLAKTKPM